MASAAGERVGFGAVLGTSSRSRASLATAAGRFPARGFTLMEMIIALAIFAILAGSITPMAMRIVDQKRRELTGRDLKQAFEAMFGSLERPVGNMRADFGFNPRQSYDALPFLVSGEAWADGAVPRFGSQQGVEFQWGYNGPYWEGPIAGGNPVDAWGMPIRLACRNENGQDTWQVRSLGPDKRESEDDLVYPGTAAHANRYNATLTVTIRRPSTPGFSGVNGTVTLRHPDGAALAVVQQRLEDNPAQRLFPITFRDLPAGSLELRLEPRRHDAGDRFPLDGSFAPLTFTLSLQQGEHHQMEVAL